MNNTIQMEVGDLKNKIAGEVILPDDPAYEEARKLYNGMIDKKPGLILKCQNSEDVAFAIHFARKHDLEVSIRSGGHNGAGIALCDDGLCIDLSLMKNIEVDPKRKIAKVEAGCILKEIDKATHEYGLALPSGIIGTTGIGGITLGGGLGYLTRKAGLTIDNLLEAEVVLADGTVVLANEQKNTDLFWALRGGGGNFGVVTSFVFQLQEISNVYAGPMFWPIEKSKEVMKFWQDLMLKSDNDLYGFFAFLAVPPADPFPEHLRNKILCGVIWNYTGPRDKAEEVFKPVREFGPPVFDGVGDMALPDLQTMLDGFYPPGLQWYWKADFFEELNEEAMDAFIKHGSALPNGLSSMHLYPVNGKAHEVPGNATAWTNRNANFSGVIVGVDSDPAKKDLITKWCKDYYNDTHPYGTGASYVNFMMEEDKGRIEKTYGDNYQRLQRIKQKYDPDNFFHWNQNIQPAEL